MILDCKNLKLDNKKITELEFKFLTVLANNEYNTWKNISDYVYKNQNLKNVMQAIYHIKHRLQRRLGLDIDTYYEIGLRLNNKLEII